MKLPEIDHEKLAEEGAKYVFSLALSMALGVWGILILRQFRESVKYWWMHRGRKRTGTSLTAE